MTFLAASSTALSVTADIEYRPAVDGLRPEAFDLIRRDDRVSSATLVYLHGGGWRVGDKAGNILPERAAAAGLTVVNANYALTESAPYPRNVDDVFALLDHLARHADDLGIDPDRVFLSGASAGGHLSSLAVTKGLAEDRLALRPAGVVSWFAPLDPVSRFLAHRYPAAHYPGSVWDRGAGRDREERDLFRPLIGTTDLSAVSVRDALDADPRFHLDRLDPALLPPFLLFVGTRDSAEIRSSQDTWYGALRSVGADVELVTVTDADHSGADFVTRATLGAALGFVADLSA